MTWRAPVLSALLIRSREMGKRKRASAASPSRSPSLGSDDSRSGGDDSSDVDSAAWAAFDAEVQAELAAQAAADAACGLAAESPPASPQARALHMRNPDCLSADAWMLAGRCDARDARCAAGCGRRWRRRGARVPERQRPGVLTV